MSSIFNFNGFQSPPRRPITLPSPISPFCTSPSQLQEVTLDQDGTFSNSLRSLNGPMRGRSLKEFEEQLTSLKKENFNLKLRIYFLEERMGPSWNADKEQVVQKNVELEVEVQCLRKDVQEKHDLLVQAVKAMDLEDDDHKKNINEKNEQLEKYRQEIESLQCQLEDLKQQENNDCLKSRSRVQQSSGVGIIDNNTYLATSHAFNLEDNSSCLIRDLEDKNNMLTNELLQMKEMNASIQLILARKDEKIALLINELDEINDEKKLLSEVKEISTDNVDNAADDEKYQQFIKLIQTKDDTINVLRSENGDLVSKYKRLKSLYDCEQKRLNKIELLSDAKCNELQRKLDECMVELKKSQDLVVANSPKSQRPNNSCDYVDSLFSVSQPSATFGSPSKNTLHVPPIMKSPKSIISSSSPTSPDSTNLFAFEQFYIRRDNDNNNCDNQSQLLFCALKRDYEMQQQKILKLKSEQLKACKIIKNMIESKKKSSEEVTLLKERIEQMCKQQQHGNNVTTPLVASSSSSSRMSNRGDVENSMAEEYDEQCCTGDDSSGDLEGYKALTIELETKNEVLLATVHELNSQLSKQRVQNDDLIDRLKKKSDRIVDLEFELLSLNQDDDHEQPLSSCCSIAEKTDTENEKNVEFYKQQIDEKNHEIAVLNEKLMKRTGDLQGLVNNELWEKNREIEKLTKQQQMSKMMENKDRRIDELSMELPKKSLQLNERLRLDTNAVCTVLSEQLEELAVFLDSLLKEKTGVLGLLGTKENKRLQKIVDQSLDLSRSFAMSMQLNPDQSLAQLSNISSCLLVGNDDTRLSYQSHLYNDNKKFSPDHDSPDITMDSSNHSIIIAALRQQIINLKYELQLRDVELNKFNNVKCDYKNVIDKSMVNLVNNNTATTSTTLKYFSDRHQSESEEEPWSEPDRSVSKARIGLVVDESFRLTSTIPNSESTATTATDEKNNSTTTPRTTPSKKTSPTSSQHKNRQKLAINDLHKRICELEEQLTEKVYELTLIKETHAEELNANKCRLNDVEKVNQDLELNLKMSKDEKEEVYNKFVEELKQLTERFNELHDKYNRVRNDLDNTTLQYSEAVLEKTRVTKDLAILDEVKSKLQVKISELESLNAELVNKLIKAQAANTTTNFPVDEERIRNSFNENNLMMINRGESFNVHHHLGGRGVDDVERNEANSSPDLGIESDHGRFSSLETHLQVSRRPLLHTLELTESMNNLLDDVTAGDGEVNVAVCGDEGHCCSKKALDLAHENNELKQKLLKTRKALEETLKHVSLANRRKKQVEREISKRIHKTSQVLREAKANLDSGSETDIVGEFKNI